MRPKKSAIHEGVRALHRLAQKAMDAPEDTPQQRRQKARALSELLVPMMRVHQARTGSLFDDLDYYPPYVHAGYGAENDTFGCCPPIYCSPIPCSSPEEDPSSQPIIPIHCNFYT
eukprot:jgi/Mesvir1/22025/Mv19577-RA.1